jgi:peptide/nickel transport system permease protein
MKGEEMPARRSAAWIIGRGIVILLISGFAGATLVRLAPGFGIDEEALDPRLSAQSIQALERQHVGERNPLTFYGRYLGGLLRGNAGRSVVFGKPIGPLLKERAPATIHAVVGGLAIGWIAAILFATASALSGRVATVLVAAAISGFLLSIPSAVLATLCLLLRLSPTIAIAAVVFPRVFPHTYEQIRASLTAPHVVMARARGVPRTRLFLFHVAPAALVPLVALGGVSITLAFGASIPIEALADSPGIGQLAWQAALGHDLPVLVGITLLLTAATVFASVLSDIAMVRLGRRAT